MTKLKLRHWPQYLIALLMLVLVVLMGWTYYLGRPGVTFERLIGTASYAQIEDLSLRRYKEGVISPHLFTIETDNEASVISGLVKECGMEKITPAERDRVLDEVDGEMVDVIQASPYLYQSKAYDLHHPKEGRLCVVFRDSGHIYLFVNGNLEGQ